MYSKWKLLSFEADGLWQHGLSQNEINTLTKFYSPEMELLLNQFQENINDLIKYSATVGVIRKTGKFTYGIGDIAAGGENELFSRQQRLAPVSDGLIDSLSGEIKRSYVWIEPGIKFKWVSEKSQLNVSLATRFANVINKFNGGNDFNYHKIYFLPIISWEKEYKNSHRIRLLYKTSVVAPKSSEYFPVTNYFDPINLFSGNQSLKPEVHNDFRLHWSIFDQFSFTSVFAGLQFSYIKDKISWNKAIGNQLVQKTTLLNVPEDFQAGANAEYSTPIRKLGVNINLSIDEKWKRTWTYINGLINKSSSLTHELGISFDNRKKSKWDISAGFSLSYVRSLFSLSSVPSQNYVKGSIFTDIGFNPTDCWQFSLKADLSNYYGQAFKVDVYIPLIQAEAAYKFLKHKRGTLSLSVFDLLNRNTGIERVSEYNYLRESQSNIIQRYIMVLFRYNLNKFISKDKIDIKVNGH